MMRSDRWVTPALFVVMITALWVSAGVGSREGRVVFDPSWWSTALSSAGVERDLLLQWRVPRTLSAAIVGAALAVAGLLLQRITRNPLADPFLLGVSGGAGLAVVGLQSVVGATMLPWWSTPGVAFVGALAAMFIVLLMARGSGGRTSVLALVLAGVVVNALCAAVMAFLLARFDPFRLRVTSTWLAGGVSFWSWRPLIGVGIAVLLVGAWLRATAHRFNAFALGSEGAAGVGVSAPRLMRHGAVLASFLAAVGVSLAGLLGYVGLIVPHAVRLLLGTDMRTALSATALAGALLVVGADTAGRVLFAPEELPVGVLTALIGCPVLLLQLRAQLRGGR